MRSLVTDPTETIEKVTMTGNTTVTTIGMIIEGKVIVAGNMSIVTVIVNIHIIERKDMIVEKDVKTMMTIKTSDAENQEAHRL